MAQEAAWLDREAVQPLAWLGWEVWQLGWARGWGQLLPPQLDRRRLGGRGVHGGHLCPSRMRVRRSSGRKQEAMAGLAMTAVAAAATLAATPAAVARQTPTRLASRTGLQQRQKRYCLLPHPSPPPPPPPPPPQYPPPLHQSPHVYRHCSPLGRLWLPKPRPRDSLQPAQQHLQQLQ